VKYPTCTDAGYEERHCTDPECPNPEEANETRSIDALGHDWSGEWYLDTAATVFYQGAEVQLCTRCGTPRTRSTPVLTPYVRWAHKVSKLPRKSSETFRVDLANGDAVTKWKSSKKNIATVSKKGVVKGKKNGKTKITAYTASGKKRACKVCC